jgi:hypothetical protein
LLTWTTKPRLNKETSVTAGTRPGEIPVAIYLEEISVRFPDINAEFTNDLASLIGVLGRRENHTLRLTQSSPSIYPEILAVWRSGGSDFLVDFVLSNGQTISVKVENSTGVSRQNPYPYQPLSMETVNQRLVTSGVRWVGLDHVGFNLPSDSV